MECAVCHVRSSVGFCPECKKLLCEVCGGMCPACGQIACREHLHQTASGALCHTCITRQLQSHKSTSSPKAPGTPAPHREVFTFQALNAGREEDAKPTQVVPRPPMPGVERVDDGRNFRVLTASLSQRHARLAHQSGRWRGILAGALADGPRGPLP